MGGRFRRRRSRSSLNPYASEFHPSFFYSFYQNYNYYHPNNNIILNFHYNSIAQHPQNYQNYPYHHHQGFIFPHNPINPMQLGHLPTAPPSAQAHFSPPHNLNEGGGGGGGRGRSRSRRRDVINTNNERKNQGFIFNNNNNNNNNDGRKIGTSNLRGGGGGGGERIVIREKTVFMAVKPNGSETTAMIRNIPNQYTREMLIKFLDEFCRIENQRLSSNDTRPPLAYDFLYLPIDFMRGANKGYAFVNFTNSVAVWKLHLACSNQPWSHCNSPKICKINYASIQGKESLMKHFGESRFICNHEEYLPICFRPPRDGSGASVVETTIGTRVSSSHPRNRLFV